MFKKLKHILLFTLFLLISPFILIRLYGISVYVTRSFNFFPSEEMKHLKDIESGLNLPTPDMRTEDDKGCNTDFKGATHYNRTIHIYYKKLEDAFTAKNVLEENGWIAKSEMVDNEDEMYWYSNDKTPEARIFLDITLKETIDTYPHALLISSTKDASICR